MEHIVKRFGDFEAVKGISLEVPPGETFGLLGPNGAGKSTLIRMMTTLIPITSGKAVIDGHDVDADPDAVRRCMGVIPQALTSDINLTVEENLSIYAKLYGVPRAERRTNIDELLEAVDLTEVARRRDQDPLGRHAPAAGDRPRPGAQPADLLPGRAHHRAGPGLPGGGVGDAEQAQGRAGSSPSCITTHYMDEADRLCDRIAIVDHGKLVALDTPARLKQSVPGNNVIEAQFQAPPDGLGRQRLGALPDVTSVQAQGAGMFRVLTANGSRTTTELVGLAVRERRSRSAP